MTTIICPNCKKSTPINNYCVICGEKLEEFVVCEICKNLYSRNSLQCPYCTGQLKNDFRGRLSEEDSKFISKLKPFRVSLTILFILSSYFITQMIVVSLIVLVLPGDFSTDTSSVDFLSLLTLLISNFLFIFFLTRYNPFNIPRNSTGSFRISVGLKIALQAILLISFLEIMLSILDRILDFMDIPSTVTSPYDTYFIDPYITTMFAILVIFIGPIFEEVIFRHHFISILGSNTESRAVILVMNGLIFSLTHLPADFLYGSLRFTIEHLTVVFFLGIVLGIIYFRFGLIYAIFFHSLWNFLSMIAQLSITHNQFEQFLNLILLIGYFLLVITLIILLYRLFTYKRNELTEFFQFKKQFGISELLSLNFLIIITFEILSALFSVGGENLFSFMLLLGLQVVALILGFLIFEYDAKKRRTQIRNSFEP
ncbi:MAG: CPBP family glutamic-type intramembrane protease [Candidatus Hodarchaeales archaeon]